MFCSLKIAGCVPKIPIGRKKIKIPTSLKISVRWCSGAICPESCKGIQGEPERMRNTRPRHGKGRATKKFFCIYIGIIAQNQKYLKKS